MPIEQTGILDIIPIKGSAKDLDLIDVALPVVIGLPIGSNSKLSKGRSSSLCLDCDPVFVEREVVLIIII